MKSTPSCSRSTSKARWWGFGVALTMAGRLHRRKERTTTTYLLYSDDIARLISELLDATTDADPAWRDQVLGLIRLALDLKRGQQ